MPNINNMTDIWESPGVTKEAIKMDVTDNGSASDSKLINLLVNENTKFSIDKSGNAQLDGYIDVRVVDPDSPPSSTARVYASLNEENNPQMMVKFSNGVSVMLGSYNGALTNTEYEYTGTYVYYGGSYESGDWQILRVTVADVTRVKATQVNNPSYADLVAAWVDRASLTYA